MGSHSWDSPSNHSCHCHLDSTSSTSKAIVKRRPLSIQRHWTQTMHQQYLNICSLSTLLASIPYTHAPVDCHCHWPHWPHQLYASATRYFYKQFCKLTRIGEQNNNETSRMEEHTTLNHNTEQAVRIRESRESGGIGIWNWNWGKGAPEQHGN